MTDQKKRIVSKSVNWRQNKSYTYTANTLHAFRKDRRIRFGRRTGTVVNTIINPRHFRKQIKHYWCTSSHVRHTHLFDTIEEQNGFADKFHAVRFRVHNSDNGQGGYTSAGVIYRLEKRPCARVHRRSIIIRVYRPNGQRTRSEPERIKP